MYTPTTEPSLTAYVNKKKRGRPKATRKSWRTGEGAIIRKQAVANGNEKGVVEAVAKKFGMCVNDH